jgi:hypothetical protein
MMIYKTIFGEIIFDDDKRKLKEYLVVFDTYVHTHTHTHTHTTHTHIYIPVKKVGSSTRSMSAAADDSRVSMGCSCIT